MGNEDIMFLYLRQVLPLLHVEMPLSIKKKKIYVGESVHAEQPSYVLIPV